LQRFDDLIANVVVAAFEKNYRSDWFGGEIFDIEVAIGQNFRGKRNRCPGDAAIEKKFFVLVARGRFTPTGVAEVWRAA